MADCNLFEIIQNERLATEPECLQGIDQLSLKPEPPAQGIARATGARAQI